MGSGSLLKVLAKNFDVLAGLVSLPVLIHPPRFLFLGNPLRVASKKRLMQPREVGCDSRWRSAIRHCWNADALRSLFVQREAESVGARNRHNGVLVFNLWKVLRKKISPFRMKEILLGTVWFFSCKISRT